MSEVAAGSGRLGSSAARVPDSSHHYVGRRSALAGGASLLACRALRAEEPHETVRRMMVITIAEHARRAGGALEGRAALDPRVLEVMRRVPRHAFVPAELVADAYEDRPLPIGYGQTISQPFIVALMTDMLRTAPGQAVLEVGTGSGYQAAVLAGLVRTVHSIEIIAPLADTAEQRLRQLGYSKVTVHRGDGYYGVPEAAPFDGIMVTAAAGSIPPPLLGQLRPGGRMVIPVGGGFALQHLVLVEKLPDGRLRTRQMLPVTFVPLVRGRGG
jgi:protein-L-isoaspartate(D-aspartate) O-methyltransferase